MSNACAPGATWEEISSRCQRPALVRPQRDRHRRPRTQRALAPTPAAHLEFLFRIQSTQLLLVHGMALPGQQEMEAAIAEAPPLPRQFAQPLANIGIVRTPGAVADR